MFCTNCGKESSKKVCPHCGVKRKRINKYCEWCGTELDINAMICPECKEKVKDAKLFTILSNIILLLPVYFLVSSILFFPLPSVIVMFLVGTILISPFCTKMVRKITHEKQFLRPVLHAIQIILVLVIVGVGSETITDKSQNEIIGRWELAYVVSSEEVIPCVLGDSYIEFEPNGKFLLVLGGKTTEEDVRTAGEWEKTSSDKFELAYRLEIDGSFAFLAVLADGELMLASDTLDSGFLFKRE